MSKNKQRLQRVQTRIAMLERRAQMVACPHRMAAAFREMGHKVPDVQDGQTVEEYLSTVPIEAVMEVLKVWRDEMRWRHENQH